MSVEISIEDFVAPAEKPHKYTELVTSLIAAGPDKVATAEFDTEEDAKAFIADMQKAARQQSKSARKRAFVELTNDKGKTTGYRVSVGVSDAIKRPRKAAE